jgi:lipocalin
MTFFFFTVAFLLASPTSAFFFGLFNRNDCPDVEPPTDFDIDQYISKTWYIQRQQVNSYQPERDLFCVIATYDDVGRRQWFRKAITVRNYGNRDSVNNPTGSRGGVLCATQSRPNSAPAKLAVAPCFLPPALFAGPYWVVAFAPDYSWAIVTGGQPSEEGECGAEEDFCTNKIGGTLFGNGEGLWFFTRAQMPALGVITAMEAKALELGICTAEMKTVVHEDCNYEGATIKS